MCVNNFSLPFIRDQLLLREKQLDSKKISTITSPQRNIVSLKKLRFGATINCVDTITITPNCIFLFRSFKQSFTDANTEHFATQCGVEDNAARNCMQLACYSCTGLLKERYFRDGIIQVELIIVLNFDLAVKAMRTTTLSADRRIHTDKTQRDLIIVNNALARCAHMNILYGATRSERTFCKSGQIARFRRALWTDDRSADKVGPSFMNLLLHLRVSSRRTSPDSSIFECVPQIRPGMSYTPTEKMSRNYSEHLSGGC